MKLKMLVAAFVLVGCGGESFTGFNSTDPTTADGGFDAPPTISTGGSSSGGAAGSSSGGAVSTGGVSASGGTVSTGGAPGSGGFVACAFVTHDNGLGQTWRDCVPLGTYDEAQAMRACAASGAAVCLKITRCGPEVFEVAGYNEDRSQIIGEWGYGDFATGYVSPTTNLCSPGDPATKRWE